MWKVAKVDLDLRLKVPTPSGGFQEVSYECKKYETFELDSDATGDPAVPENLASKKRPMQANIRKATRRMTPMRPLQRNAPRDAPKNVSDAVRFFAAGRLRISIQPLLMPTCRLVLTLRWCRITTAVNIECRGKL